MTWSEQDGPEVEPPTHRGFGRRMLEKGVAHELGGEIVLDHAPTGLICRMTLPASRTLRHVS